MSETVFKCHFNRCAKLFLILVISMMQSACVDDVSSTNGGGSGGSGKVQGSVTTFGSVFVNGIKFNTDNAVITIDGQPATEDMLHAGMVVTVEGNVDPGHTTGEAKSINVIFNVIGQIDSIDLNRGKIKIADQTVLFNALTVFKSGDINSLSVKDIIAVSGTTNASNGVITAGYIEKRSADVAVQIDIEGILRDLDDVNKIFRLNEQTISYIATHLEIDNLNTILENGLLVRVIGNEDGSGIIEALRIDNKTPSLGGTVGDLLIINGVVDQVTSETQFTLNGNEVSTTPETRYIDGNIIDIALNKQLKISGKLSQTGMLQAEEITFVIPSDIEISGNVQTINTQNKQLLVDNRFILIDNSVILQDESIENIQKFSLKDIHVGDQLVVKGYDSGVAINAAFIKRLSIPQSYILLLQKGSPKLTEISAHRNKVFFDGINMLSTSMVTVDDVAADFTASSDNKIEITLPIINGIQKTLRNTSQILVCGDTCATWPDTNVLPPVITNFQHISDAVLILVRKDEAYIDGDNFGTSPIVQLQDWRDAETLLQTAESIKIEITNTRIGFTVPLHAGNGDVSVTTMGGTASLSNANSSGFGVVTVATGFVRDEAGNPIEDALISISHPGSDLKQAYPNFFVTTTDSSGFYSIKLPQWFYIIHVSKDGFIAQEKGFAHNPLNTSSPNFNLVEK